MTMCIFYLIAVLNIPSFLQSPPDNTAFSAINMIKLKAKYPFLFADYHPAKSAYHDPRFIYYYRNLDPEAVYPRIGLMKKINIKGFEYLGKVKINPPRNVGWEFNIGSKIRIPMNCGNKPMKPLYTADGIPIND